MLLHWHFDPILLTLGPLTLRWYGLLFVGAFFLGQAVLERIFRAEGLPVDKVQRLLLWALLGTIAGARLAHCLVYEPQRYLADPLSMLRTWDGGMASHGGALGLLLGWLMLLVFSVRVAAEHFKTAQAAREAGFAASAGQLLSLPFIVAGGLLVVRAAKNARPTCGTCP